MWFLLSWLWLYTRPSLVDSLEQWSREQLSAASHTGIAEHG